MSANKTSHGIFRFKKALIAVIIIVLVALSFLFTFGPSVSDDIPGWSQISKAAGVYDGTSLAGGNKLSVHMLDIDKSDSILISYRNYNVLIDAGYTGANHVTTTYLQRCGIKKLDLVVVTHPDIDHIHEIPVVLETFKIERFWTTDIVNDLKPDTTAYTDMNKLLDSEKIPVTYVQSGKTLTLGKMKFTVIAPINKYDSTNNCSVAVRLDFCGTSWLFCGDIEKEAEQDILNSGADIDVDVLKVAHHGSKTSSTSEFIKAVSPKISLISTNFTKSLPDSSVLERLKKENSEIYVTACDGDIVLYTTGDDIKVQTFEKD